MPTNIRQFSNEEMSFDEPDIKAETDKEVSFEVIKAETEELEKNDIKSIPEII